MMIRRIHLMRASLDGAGVTNKNTGRDELRVLVGAGLLLFVGCVALFFLLHSRSLWAASNVVADQWPGFYKPITDTVDRLLHQMSGDSDFGVLNSRLYHLILLWLFAVYLFIVFRAFRSDTFSDAPGKRGKAPLVIILAIT